VGRQAEEGAGLGQQVVPIGRAADREDLERHRPVVSVVERLDDPALAPGAQRVQELVALVQQLGHRSSMAP
jgi:hypothetical protein